MARKTTRSAQGGGTIRQRKDGRWEARYTVGRDPGSGKQIQRSVYGSTQKEVRQKLAAAVAALDSGTYIAPSKMTVGQWLDIWQRDYLGGLKPSTRALYSDHCRVHIKPALGAIKLGELSPHAIQGFYNELGKEHDGKPGLAAQTVHSIHSTFHKALRQAVALKYVRDNPTEECTLPRKEKTEIHPLTDAQVAQFLAVIKGCPYETLYKVALLTGMRQGELLGLGWDSVDFDAGTITIRQQLRRGIGKGEPRYLSLPKNNKPRTIAPAPRVMQLLRAHRHDQLEQRLMAGPLWEESGMVFTTATGGYLPNGTIQDHFRRKARKIGLTTTRFHDLRHTYAVNAIRAGDDIKTVQHNLGHHSAAFTLDVYGHFTEDMQKASAARMESFIGQVWGL